MLNEAIGDLLPSALAVALGPIPIIAVVLVLGTPKARTAQGQYDERAAGGLDRHTP